MKICRFNDERIGLVVDEAVIDISGIARDAGVAPPQRLNGDPLVMALSGIAERLSSLDLTSFNRSPLASVRLNHPVRFPTKIVAGGSNYPKHRSEKSEVRPTGRRGYDFYTDGPLLKANSSLAGAADTIELRFPERVTHHEIELVAVIGKLTDDVSPESALDYVAGYCIGLDISLIGQEEKSLRKSFDTYTVIGPWLVTSDEVSDPSKLEITLKVNGVVSQQAVTSEMVVDVQHMVAFASKFYRLYPGDILFTGTPSGTAPIAIGDRLEATISSIGSMTIGVAPYLRSKS